MATYTAISNNHDGRILKLSINQVQNVGNNTSTLNWTLYSDGGSANYYYIAATTIKINNVQVYNKAATQWSDKVFPAAKGNVSGSITVTHNADGNLTVPVYFYTGVYSNAEAKDYGGNFVLTKNLRGATITYAPNFNDEQNPMINYSNPSGSQVTSLQVGISANGTLFQAPYRAITPISTSGSYTFNLTNEERNNLRNIIYNGTEANVTFFLRSTINGTNYYDSAVRKVSVINASPILNPTLAISPDNSDLTGNTNTIISGVSNVNYTIGASAQKLAAIKTQSVINGSSKLTAPSGVLAKVTSKDFKFSATDTRGLTTTKTLSKSIVNYIKLTISGSVFMTVDGVITIKAEGDYFNASFGAQYNSLTLQAIYKEDNGDWGEWINITPTLNGNKYSGETQISGLDYRKTYTINIRAIDKIGSAYSGYKVCRAVPVFDWGKDDFQFNVPVKLSSMDSYVVPASDNGTSWINGRIRSLVKTETADVSSAFYPIASIKTPQGAWAIGTYGEDLYFIYTTDSDFEAGNNNKTAYMMTHGTNKNL